MDAACQLVEHREIKDVKSAVNTDACMPDGRFFAKQKSKTADLSLNINSPFKPNQIPTLRDVLSYIWDAGSWFVPIGGIVAILAGNKFTTLCGVKLRGENLIPATICIASLLTFFISGLSMAFDGKRRMSQRVHDWVVLRITNIAFCFTFAGVGYGLGLFLGGLLPSIIFSWRPLGYSGCCAFFGFYVLFMYYSDSIWSQRPNRSRATTIVWGVMFAILGMYLMTALLLSIPLE